jgi:YYY domain-containing protein
MEYALVVRWLATFLLLGGAGLPVAARLFRRFPGGGAGLALPVALVLVALPAYWVGHLAYGPPALAAGVVVLLVTAVLAAADRDALREGRLVRAPGLALDRRAAGEAAAVFTAGFLLVVAIRAVDPAVVPVGGEKFLDFGLLKALARAGTLPPEDFWFAGEPVRYYYGGHLVAHLLAMLSGTPVRYAYNLALAGFFGTLLAAAYELAGAVAANAGRSRRTAGVAAVFFVGFASNLYTAGRLLVGALPAPLRTPISRAVADAAGVEPSAVPLSAAEFFYWDASRIIPGTINEFPLFAWLNGDLHAHMTGTPFLLTAAALAYAVYLAPASATRRRRALVFGAVPLLASLQAVVDTWSFPSVFGLLWLALTFAPADAAALLPPDVAARVRAAGERLAPGRLGVELLRPVAALAATGVSGVLAALLAAPFLLTAAGGGRSVAVLPAEAQSSLGGLVVVHGAFLAVFVAYFLVRGGATRRPAPVLAVGALAVVALEVGPPVLLVAGPLLVGGWVLLRLDAPVEFETVLVVAGAGLVGLVEVVYVAEQAGPLRLNTVFKTYTQVWVLWGTAAGVALPALVFDRDADADAPADADRRRSADGAGGTGTRATDGGTARGLATDVSLSAPAAALGIVLVLSTAVYGGLALSNHFAADGAGTLDATAFVADDHPEYAGAIRWLDEREGRPTIVSAPGTSWKAGAGYGHPPGRYSWQSNPASSLTGVPAVAGWHHEVGYRGREAYFQRVRDVDTIFEGRADERAALLAEYDVRYVWVGPAERARYGEAAATVGETPGVEFVREIGSVRIYRVDQTGLSA